MEHEEYLVKQLRQLPAKERSVLAVLCNGAQLVMRADCAWEAYAEIDGKVRPLGLRLSHDRLQAVSSLVEGITVELNGDPEYAWLPSAHREKVRDLLTQSMPTQHLVFRWAEFGSDTAAHNLRTRERQAA